MYGLNDTRSSRLQICIRETLRFNFCKRCFNELHLESAIFVFPVTNYMDVITSEREEICTFHVSKYLCNESCFEIKEKY